MALPSTGEISFNLFNTDRNIASGTQVDMDTAAIAYGIPTKPHGMDEFRGRGTGTPPTPAPPTPAPPTPAPPTPAPPTPAPPTPAPPTPPPPTPAPQVYTYLSQCGTGGVAQGHIFGSYTYGINIYDEVNEICYITVGTSLTPTDTHLFRATIINGCTCPTPPPPTPPPPTPAPAVSANVTQDCNGTSGASGRIFITNITNGGSNCYVGYDIESGPPSAYATVYIGSATSHTFTSVGDYGGSYSVYIFNQDTGNGVRYGIGAVACYVAPPPTPPPPTPAPVYYIALSTGDTACEAKQNFSGPQN
jgi:hypothetical protein